MTLGSFNRPIHALVLGASGGVGLGFVHCLLQSSGVAKVVAGSRKPLECTELRSLEERYGSRLEALTVDVAEEASITRAAETLGATTERIDLLINCAGVLHDDQGMRPERKLDDVEPPNLLRSFQVNALGALLVAKHFNRFFDRTDRCVLANLSARVGSIGDNRLGGWYAYRTSKSAQNMITRNLSIELRRRYRGIICVALHPGTVDTELSKPFQASVPEGKLFSTGQAARQLLAVIDSLGPESNGHFYAWNGEGIAW